MVKAMRVCLDNILRWGANPRIYILCALALLMIKNMMVRSILEFSQKVHVHVAPWVYPFLADDWYISMLIQFGAVLLFCDAPFMNEGTPYLFVRSGRKCWFWGQVLYISVATLLYTVFLALSSALLLIPRLEWNMDWGKVLGTLAHQNAYDIFISLATQTLYTPIQATLWALTTNWLVVVIIGMIIFTANLFLPRAWGSIIGAMFALLAAVTGNFSGTWMYFISPGCWMRLSNISHTGFGLYPSLGYIFTAGFLVLTALTCVSYLRFMKHPIETLPNI